MKLKTLSMIIALHLVACGQAQEKSDTPEATRTPAASASPVAPQTSRTPVLSAPPTTDNSTREPSPLAPAVDSSNLAPQDIDPRVLVQQPRLGTSDLTLAPPEQFTIEGQDARTLAGIMRAAGVAEQSSIESVFYQAPRTICANGISSATNLPLSICLISTSNSELFGAASAEDADTLVQLLRKYQVPPSRVIETASRWDLVNLECSRRFDLKSRTLVHQCTFQI